MKTPSMKTARSGAVAPNTTPYSPKMVDIPNPNPEVIAGGGVKIRGTGAATKGLMARGPMG